MKLPSAPWQTAKPLAAVVTALGEGNARFVGGAVRDTLLGLDVSDVDLATPLTPAEVVARLEAAGLKAVPTGIAHGTVTAVSGGRPFEVTTLRRDVATDGRHAEVEFTADWRADAARRDFTINALYADPATAEISDWFGGLADLEARAVRFIGDPLERIAEDHLRILRFFRFHARFGAGEPDSAGLAACAARANDLMALSRERVRDELLKLLAVGDPVATLTAMLAHAILAPVLPEIGEDGLAKLRRLVAVERARAEPAVPLRRLAALLPPGGPLFDEIASRLRLSNAERKRLAAMAEPLEAIPDDARPLAYAIGKDSARDRLLLAAESADTVTSPLGTLDAWTIPRFPLSGRDILALGISAGPEVARILQAAERDWVAAAFPDRAAALDLARAAVAQRPVDSSSIAS